MTSPDHPFARLRLDGDRFEGGRLPISALQELERYERLIRSAAEAAWRADNPGRRLPGNFRKNFSLAIASIEEGSATSILVRETTSSKYEAWYEQAGSDVDEAFEALVRGSALPTRLEWSNYKDFADFGSSLTGGEAIELYPPDGQVVRYTEEVRLNVAERLRPRQVEPDEVKVDVTRMVAGRLNALDADRQTFRMRRLGGAEIRGAFSSADLTEDLRDVLNSSAMAPVVRVEGLISIDSEGLPQRVLDAVTVELFEIDGAPWSGRLIELAELEPGWLEGAGSRVQFDALDAARDTLRMVQERGIGTPAIFPTEDGGVQLQWASPERVVTFEVAPDLQVSLLSLIVSPREFTASEFISLTEAQDELWRVIS